MAKKKPARKKATAVAKVDTPIGDATNKSEAIRVYLEAHKGAKNAAVVDALKSQGIEVTANYVSMIKTKSKKKAGKRGPKPGSKRKAVSHTSNGHGSLLHTAAAFVAAAGGLASAKQILDEIGAIKG